MEPRYEPKPSLVFRVRRQEPELVAPARPTPRELKTLSVLDSQDGLRRHIRTVMVYRNNPSMKGKDPVKVIREAVAQALVFYYPFAGRVREGPSRKLYVDCTGEGILFIEADADVALVDFGPVLQPPFPCFEELLFDVPDSAGVLHCPLLLIQVTRFKCTGFIFAIRLNHVMSDAAGIVQFMSTVGEMARGAMSPSTPPLWNREFFCARDPPHVTHTYIGEEYTIFTPSNDHEDVIEKSFFFGPSQVSALRSLVPNNLYRCSTYDLLTACLWRCRTAALGYDPKDDVHALLVVNARGLHFNPPVPAGYYGNAFVHGVASATAESLCHAPFGYALELVRKAKEEVNEEYVRSTVDLMEIKGGRPLPALGRCFSVTDARHAGFADVDFGWGRAAYGGPALSGNEAFKRFVAFYVACKNHEGEDGTAVLMCLPRAAMETFESELRNMLNDKTVGAQDSHFIRSGL